MEYAVEPGSEGLRLDLERLDAAYLRVGGGEVSLAGTSSPPRLEVDGVIGEPVSIGLHDGVLTVEHPSTWSGRSVRSRATIVLTMPPAAATTVHSESAALVAAGLAGRMSFTTASGEVTGTCLSGDVRARTVSGEVALDGVAGRLQVESASGPVTIVGGRLQEAAISTMTGEAVADLDPRPGARCSCCSASGPVTVRLPADASVDFEAQSLMGQIDVPDWAERSEEEAPPWARGWPGMAHAWSGAAAAWAARTGEWAGRAGALADRAGAWADAVAGAGARLLGDPRGAAARARLLADLLGDPPSTRLLGDPPWMWARDCLHLGGLGRVVRGRLGQGDVTLRMASLLGDISMVCGAPVEAVA
jgi:hypothetical protein